MIEQRVLKGYFNGGGNKIAILVFFVSKSISNCSSIFNIKDNTSDTVSISKFMNTLMVIPKVFAIFISWSGLGLGRLERHFGREQVQSIVEQ